MRAPSCDSCSFCPVSGPYCGRYDMPREEVRQDPRLCGPDGLAHAPSLQLPGLATRVNNSDWAIPVCMLAAIAAIALYLLSPMLDGRSLLECML